MTKIVNLKIEDFDILDPKYPQPDDNGDDDGGGDGTGGTPPPPPEPPKPENVKDFDMETDEEKKKRREEEKKKRKEKIKKKGKKKKGKKKPGQSKPGDPDYSGMGDPPPTPPKKGKDKPKGGNPDFKDNPEEMDDIPHVDDETPGQSTRRDLGDSLGKNITTKAKEYKDKSKKSQIHRKKIKPNWSELRNNAMSRNSDTLSAKAKALLTKIKGTSSLVDWKKELKKFFDSTFKSIEWKMPNKRHLAAGNVLYGSRRVGEDTLKTIVAAVDTSGSISNKQAEAFVNEVMVLCKLFDADMTYIIYCSDDIDGIDIVKKGGKPDFTKMKSTGGNRLGFIPPFQYVEKMKIKPSLFIYLTDTGGDMPDPKMYGISKYIKKVLWFICSPTMYNPPPFGKILFAPVGSIRTR
jgi:hypothetical protein